MVLIGHDAKLGYSCWTSLKLLDTCHLDSASSRCWGPDVSFERIWLGNEYWLLIANKKGLDKEACPKMTS